MTAIETPQILDSFADHPRLVLAPSEEQFARLVAELIETFSIAEASNNGENGHWARLLLECGWNHLDSTPAELTADQVAQIVVDIFPLIIPPSASYAQPIITELRSFWRWLDRVHSHPAAAEVLDLLEELEEDYDIILTNETDWQPHA